MWNSTNCKFEVKPLKAKGLDGESWWENAYPSICVKLRQIVYLYDLQLHKFLTKGFSGFCEVYWPSSSVFE